MLKNKFSKTAAGLVFALNLLALSVIAPTPALAACKTSATLPVTKITKDSKGEEIIKTETIPGKVASNDEISKCLKDNKLIKALNNIINVLAAGVGVAVTGSIIFGGIQYAAAGNNPNQVTAAKKRITDALIALIAFAFMYAFLQWIVPGGVFG
jgi:hypothetical protein